MYKGAMTEEIHEVETESSKSDFQKQKWRALSDIIGGVTNEKIHGKYLAEIARIAVQHSENVVRQYFPDTVTPPPNFI